MSELNKENKELSQTETNFSEHAANLTAVIKTACSQYVAQVNARSQKDIAILSFASSWACAMVAAEAGVAATVIAGHDFALSKEYMNDLQADMNERFARTWSLVSDQFKKLAEEEVKDRLQKLEESEQGEE
ncbi:hypothetical protein [Ferrovum sp.]|uniref:hypothetical protein n=1 Tax=Ferrovum sp. TaxID=2609467 RepID=UPI002602CAA9|nr:hypothetical protein [Ferrovum sp.]